MLYTRPVVVLQVMPSRVPRDESSVTNIWLLAVTAVVFTTRVEPPVDIATLPADAALQTAGDAEELQFAVVEAFPQVIVPGTVTATPDFPIIMFVAVFSKTYSLCPVDFAGLKHFYGRTPQADMLAVFV